MASPSKKPTEDLVQLFCTNFDKDLNGKQDFDDSWNLKKFRQVCDIFNSVLAQKNKDVAITVLEFYAPTPLEKFCSIISIIEALAKEKLIDSNADRVELAKQLETDFENWKIKAIEESKKLLIEEFPEVNKFKGETAWIHMNEPPFVKNSPYPFWGAVCTLTGKTNRKFNS